MQPSLTKPLARYAQTRTVAAVVFLAGQGARDPATNACAGLTRDGSGRIVAHDITAQTAAVFANVERALATEGLSRRDLVDVTVFLTDMDEFDAMNAVWNEFFRDVPPPTRTTVAVSRLPGDNFVEMKAVAAKQGAV